jgi:hypothetical protein
MASTEASNIAQSTPPDGTGVIQLDPYLEPFRDALRHRFGLVESWIKKINENEGGLDKFSKGYEKFGFNVNANGDITYREWAPNAVRAYLVGDFSKSHSISVAIGGAHTELSRQVGCNGASNDKRQLWRVGSNSAVKGRHASHPA